MQICGHGGIGRRAGFRFQWATVQVQVLLAALLRNDKAEGWSIGNTFGVRTSLPLYSYSAFGADAEQAGMGTRWMGMR